MELAELHVCAASCWHMYAPVATFPAAAAQQRFLDIVNALLISAFGFIDLVNSLMLGALAGWSSWEVKPRGELPREERRFYLKCAYVCMQDLGGDAKGDYVRHVVLPPCYHAATRQANGKYPTTALTCDCWRVEVVRSLWFKPLAHYISGKRHERARPRAGWVAG